MADPTIPPNDSWREHDDINWVKDAQGDGIIGIGLKALGSFALGDTREKTALWLEKKF